MSVAREIGRQEGRLRIAIADDSRLIYSDNYREGWVWGFESIGCEVKVFDISMLRGYGARTVGASPYRAVSMRGTPRAVAEDIARWNPSLVFCHHAMNASGSQFLGTLKKKRIKVAAYFCDEPYESGWTVGASPGFDYVFTMDPCTLEAHRVSRSDRAPVVFYLPPGVHTDKFKPSGYEGRNVPAFFLGAAELPPRPDWLKPVDNLIEGCQICYWGNKKPKKHGARWIGIQDHPKHYASCIVGLNVHRDPAINENCFRHYVLMRPPSLPIPAGLTFSKTRPKQWGTGFRNDGNLPAAHINPRFFEMAACGTLVVNDNHRSELERMFPMAPRAESPDHFYELVRYYLDHKDEAEEIGQACSSLISRRHSYKHRAGEVLIRAGFKESGAEDLRSFLGEPADWLTPQPSMQQRDNFVSELTGPSERWSPQYGRSMTRQSTFRREVISIDAPSPWLW